MKKFIFSCGILLTVAALSKLYSASGDAPILYSQDPLLLASNRAVMCAAAGVELLVVAFMLMGPDNVSKCVCIGWLAFMFSLYRAGLFLLHPGRPCHCLGNLDERLEHLGLKPQATDRVLEIVVAYMLVGSIVLLIRDRDRRRVGRCSSI
jgi:hypothetical protein